MFSSKPEKEFRPDADVILNAIADGIIVLNVDGVIVYANPATETIFGRSHGDLVGTPFGHPVSTREVNEFTVMHGRDTKIVQMIVSPIHWDGEQVCLLSLRNVTELVQISKELEQKSVSLERINSELEQYASLASHDLKEPIRKIKYTADRLLTKATHLDEDTKVQLRKIGQAANRLQMLVAGIAEFSEIKARQAHLTRVDLNEVLKNVLTDLDLSIAEKEAHINIEQLPAIEAVPVQMHRLFLNLVSNAIKYSRPGITPEITIRGEEDDEYITITISDNGIGIDAQYADKIFQPFQRLFSKEVEGSGIGLTICKKIVEAHGGVIGVDSIKGSGSQFRFSLPKQQ